jgi:hypothetical protein
MPLSLEVSEELKLDLSLSLALKQVLNRSRQLVAKLTRGLSLEMKAGQVAVLDVPDLSFGVPSGLHVNGLGHLLSLFEE